MPAITSAAVDSAVKGVVMRALEVMMFPSRSALRIGAPAR
jgi:hypothetical protein